MHVILFFYCMSKINTVLSFIVVFFCQPGVADGVGGWRSYGVDPSLFPQSLMAACERMVKSGQFNPQKPVEVLSTGYYEVQQDKKPLIGVMLDHFDFGELLSTCTV